MPCPPAPAAGVARIGIATRTTTVSRSSTISQPTATWPEGVSTRAWASSPRSNTTVLATDRARPSTSPEAQGIPNHSATSRPRSVEAALWMRAPGTATWRTASSSRGWKCRPTPNISSTTPTSASWLASATSPTKPGVWGPMSTPASM